MARKFAENVVGSLGAVKGESFKGPIILAPKAAAEMLRDPIASSVRASKPLAHQGTLIENIRMRFEAGRVVEARASRGEAAIAMSSASLANPLPRRA